MFRLIRCVGYALLVAFSLASLAPVRDTVAATPRCNGVPATITGAGVIVGTAGPDVIVGSNGADAIDSFGGDDLICGRGGNDSIVSGAGNDVIFGEGGNDGITDLEGDNTAEGGTGADSIDLSGQAFGGSGDDPFVSARKYSADTRDAYASGGSGQDYVEVIGGTADGGSGNDHVLAYGIGDRLLGSSGSDQVDSFNGGQYLDCGSAFDSYSADITDTVLTNCEERII